MIREKQHGNLGNQRHAPADMQSYADFRSSLNEVGVRPNGLDSINQHDLGSPREGGMLKD